MSEALAINLGAPCWLFQGGKAKNGYGLVRAEARLTYAHRYMWAVMRGPIPPTKQIDHLCRVRHCVNPQHMELVTQRENLLRGNGWAGLNARKTHCPKGHELITANTYPSGTGRRCRQCFLEWAKAHRPQINARRRELYRNRQK